MEIYDETRLICNLYDKWDDFKFPIVSFPFPCSNITAEHARGAYISPLIRYPSVCTFYMDSPLQTPYTGIHKIDWNRHVRRYMVRIMKYSITSQWRNLQPCIGPFRVDRFRLYCSSHMQKKGYASDDLMRDLWDCSEINVLPGYKNLTVKIFCLKCKR